MSSRNSAALASSAAAAADLPANGDTAARAWRLSAMVFVTFECLYVALRSGNMLSVDGAHRSIEVFRRQTVFFHGSNHMLYPVNVLLWTRLLALFGVRSDDPMQFFSRVELMNCTAAALCVAILCFWIYRTVPSWPVALGASAGYGLSRAFIEQATNANEPLVGLLWSFVAVSFAIASLRTQRRWPLIVSGLFFALAMATYQSMIFLAPAVVLGILFSPRTLDENERRLPKRLLYLGCFALGGLAAGAVIYGWAYQRMGISNPITMWKRFAALEGGRTEAGVGFAKILNVPVGLLRNVFPVLHSYSGLHAVLASPEQIVLLLLAFILFVSLLVGCFLAVRAAIGSSSPFFRAMGLSAFVALCFTLTPVLIWDPNYDKLWLQPLACLAFLVAIALGAARNRLRTVSTSIAVLVLCLIAGNLVWTARLHAATTPGLAEAKSIAQFISDRDFVVSGWDSTSTMYGEIWADDARHMDFIQESVDHGAGVMPLLRQAISDTEKRSGKVYFIGLLDMSEKDWNAYLGSKCGVPFSAFDPYRAGSRVTAILEENGTETRLFELNSAATPPGSDH